MLPEIVEVKRVSGRHLTATDIALDTFDVEQKMRRTGRDKDGLPTGDIYVLVKFQMTPGAKPVAVGDIISIDPEVFRMPMIYRADSVYVLRVTYVYAHLARHRSSLQVPPQVHAEGLWLDGTYVIDWVKQMSYQDLRNRAPKDAFARFKAITMARKIKALAERPGTEGEGAAARQALERVMAAWDLTEADLG